MTLFGSINPPKQGYASIVRRRGVVGVTLVAGTAVLAAALAAPAGSALFHGLALLAGFIWIAGAALSGLHSPRRQVRRSFHGMDVVVPVMLGAVFFGLFFAGRLLTRGSPVLSGSVESVLARAHTGPPVVLLLVALVNAVGEELFFRNALHAAFSPPHQAVTSTAVYCLVTIATLNLALVVSAVVMGTLFSTQRKATGSVIAPTLTHLTWSTLMLLALPR